MFYLIRVKPKGRTSFVHIDRLKVFQGDVPAHWKDSVIESEEHKAGPNNREAAAVRPHLSAEVDSKKYQESSSHSAGTGQQNNKARLEPASDKLAGHAAACERRRQQANSWRATPQQAPYRLRSPTQRSLPARFQ